MSSRVWFITGCSSGFGQRIAQIAVSRNDRVIASARNMDRLKAAFNKAGLTNNENIKLFQLDVTESESSLASKLGEAVKIWGKIDVLVNNAGYGQLCFMEEAGSSQLKKQFDTNVFGLLNVTNAVLPHMRERRSGTIVQIGSRSEWSAETPMKGIYAAGKAAVRVFSESLASEVKPFGIRFLIVEPGAFRTEGIYDNGQYTDNQIPDYEPMRKIMTERIAAIPGKEPGDPDKGMEAVVDVVQGTGKAAGKEWPLYLFLGTDAEKDVRNKCKILLDLLDSDWNQITRGVSFTESN
jgi:NAD(P)-dependent dehydrogenase (short-subunit alcohol dehydrogenase family)